MNVLISLLGLSPGVATGAYYALTRDRGVPIHRLVTLTTCHHQVEDCEGMIEGELERWQLETGSSVEYTDVVTLPWPEQARTPAERRDYRALLAQKIAGACRLRVPSADVNTEDEVALFRDAILALVRDVYREDEVYLCLAGGRKSMAGIAAIAAHLYGDNVQGLFHLYVRPELEEKGAIDVLMGGLSDEEQQQVLCPAPGEVWPVELSFFQFVVGDGGPGLALRGQMQEYILEYLIENEELVTVLEPDTWGQVLGYVFEAQVANALNRANYWALPHYRFGDGDIDVLATKKGADWIDEYSRYEAGLVELLNRLVRAKARADVSNLDAALSEVAPTRMDLAKLRRILVCYFNDSELRDLYFDLGVDYEALPGQGKRDKARELIAYLDRQERITELVRLGYQLRPHASWGDTPKENQQNRAMVRKILSQKLPRRYSEALVYQQRLQENIDKARLYGDTETRRAERSEIVHRLNTLAVSALNTPFNALCAPEEIVVCECKFSADPTQPLLAGKVNQAIKYRAEMQKERPRDQVHAWVVTNAETAEDTAWRRAADNDVQIMTTGKLASKVLRKLNSGKWIALVRENWIMSDIQPMEQS